MTDEIRKELLRLESQHNIKILLAVESGSRAWGFASTDSDWDVRYIYMHRLDWYLQIDEQRDTQEEILANDIDLAGWEVKKALRLFRKSNPAMLEWLSSPIVYLEQFSTAAALRDLTKNYFNPKACLYHYFHMAEGNYREYLQGDLVRVKKYFYVLRPLLACEWIRQNQTMAPIEFPKLVESQVVDAALKKEIELLLSRKIAGEELNLEPKNKIIDAFIEERLLYYKEYLKTFNPEMQPDTSVLNELFRKALGEVWQK